ncbi:MAG: subfamily polymerase sigma factor, partial [Caulobacteraceae bacterium]|nr:subfamily polymerase sigma factor [Caulobacteraceae bacterium]
MTTDFEHDAAFQSALVRIIPQMRAFARSLCQDATLAEDLAQDAVAKAWSNRAGFTMGTNIKAWAFMILRNQFYSDKRR